MKRLTQAHVDQFKTKDVKIVTKSCAECVNTYPYDYIDATNARAYINDLTPLVARGIEDPDFLVLHQKACWLMAGYYEALDKPKKAWQYYGYVIDQKLPFFNEVLLARKRLLLKTITSPASVNNNNAQPATHNPLKEKWSREAVWFDSFDGVMEVDEDEDDLDAAFKKMNINDENKKKYLPSYRQTLRRHKAERKFFDPKRSNNAQELQTLTQAILDNRYRKTTDQTQPVDLAGKSSRLLITAERAYQESAIELSESGSPKLNIPTARAKPWDTGHRRGETLFGPVEQYKIHDSIAKAEHRVEPKPQRLGDSFSPDHGSYSKDIYVYLNDMAQGNKEKEKKLAQWMIRYAKQHQSVTETELKEIHPDNSVGDVHKFNKICFLIMEKEQSQWHSATFDTYQLGMAVSQARCLIMMAAGFISFAEAFKNDVLLGVYSQTKILDYPSSVANACNYIDRLYTAYLQMQNPNDHFTFLKQYAHTRAVVLTQEQAHQDLRQVYGGHSDSDEDAYLSDLSM